MAYIDELIEQGDHLFDKRSGLLSLWQTIADNFYPERADFTTARNIGEEFASNLMTSYPIIARRDLGNAIGSMLRPTSKAWFHVRTHNYDQLGTEAKGWLQSAEERMRHAMHDRRSQFARATKEGDHDFATFGQCAIQASMNKEGNGLLYRCWHLRDVAWAEDAEGMVGTVHRRWKPSARELVTLFGDKVHDKVKTVLAKEPFKEYNVRHCIIPLDSYRGTKTFRTPFVSLYFDVDNKHLMEEVGLMSQEYTIPRWQTVSGSQYAYSPATVAALPDSRLIQAMTRVLLNAGEKAVNPPMLAVQEAIRSDISIYAGGITWVDAEYDERLGEVLRPLTQDTHAIPLGIDMADRLRGMISEAFFLNKIALPQPAGEMTAYEVGQRVQEYIRQALPLFEPMESDYNGPLCDKTFEIMLRAGALGSPLDLPKELQGAELIFQFESPLHDAIEREKGQRFLEAKSMLADAVALDPNTVDIIDASAALRDVLEGIGVPAKWTRSEEVAKGLADKRAQQQQNAELLQQLQQSADIAGTLGAASAGNPQPSAGFGAA